MALFRVGENQVVNLNDPNQVNPYYYPGPSSGNIDPQIAMFYQIASQMQAQQVFNGQSGASTQGFISSGDGTGGMASSWYSQWWNYIASMFGFGQSSVSSVTGEPQTITPDQVRNAPVQNFVMGEHGTIEGGVLQINGTEANDTILLYEHLGQVRIFINNVNLAINPSDLQKITRGYTIKGGEGNDHLSAEGSGLANITIEGGQGNDMIVGGTANDRLLGGEGDDFIYGRLGDDTIEGGEGKDVLRGEEGNNHILGGLGEDSIYGGDGNDTLEGGFDNDKIYGGEGNDTIRGDAGNDEVYGELGEDKINGNSGDDLLYGGEDDDTINGDEGSDRIWGGDGEDRLYGNEGDDYIRGEEGRDAVYGESRSFFGMGGSGPGRRRSRTPSGDDVKD